MSSETKRSRLSLMSSSSWATLASVEAIESAPAMKRRRGGCSFATAMSASASFAGSPVCLPSWERHPASSALLRSA
jgi:hypothetical protein